MAGVTPIYGFPYQELADPPNGATLGKNLAEAIETKLAAMEAQRPAGKMRGGGQSFTSAVEAAVDMTSTVLNNGGMADLANNRFNVTVPGTYLAVGSLRWAPGATGYRAIGVAVGGTMVKRVSTDTNTAFGVQTEQEVVAFLTLVAGNQVSLRAIQTQGAALLTESTFADSTSLSLHLIQAS